MPATVIYDLDFNGAETGTYQATFGSPSIQSVGPLNDALVFHALSGGEQIQLPIGIADARYDLQFDVLAHNLLDSDYAFAVYLDTALVRTVNFHGGLNGINVFQSSPFLNLTLAPFANDTVYHVGVAVDFQTHLWSVAIGGAPMFTGALDGTPLQNIRFGLAPWIGGAANTPGTYAALDNIVVTVPEPSSAILVAVGAFAWWRRHRQGLRSRR